MMKNISNPIHGIVQSIRLVIVRSYREMQLWLFSLPFVIMTFVLAACDTYGIAADGSSTIN